MGGIMAVGWIVLAAQAAATEPALERFQFNRVEMAVPVKITLYSRDATVATRAAHAAFDRFHSLNAVMSDYDETSELRRLCETAGAGRAVPVSGDLWMVLVHSQEVSAQSEGAFDVTAGPEILVWRRARRQRDLPSASKIEAARALVDYRQVKLDPTRQTVELLKKGMRLDLGGIAKGYANDEALRVLERAGIHRAMVEAGGDVRLGDAPPGEPGWRIGIPAPDTAGPPVRYLVLSRAAISTSGDTMQYVDLGGKRYSHIVDPRTGWALTDHCRVIVVAPTGMAADAVTKAIAVLGPEKGLKLIEAMPAAAALVTRSPQGPAETFESARWKDLPLK